MNKIDLSNRTAIVTGGAQGFGLAITKRLLDSRASVIIWDVDKNAVEKTLKELNSAKLSSGIIDVTNFEQVKAETAKVTKNVNIDILYSF